MTDYTGLKCPVCGKAFTVNDDIVVCPECGAPYHRECYAQVGKCVFAEKHGTPDAWAPPQSVQGEAEKNTKHCPNCGAPNSESALFCEHCGHSLLTNQQDFHGLPQNGGSPPNGGFPQNGLPFNPPQTGNFPQSGSPYQPIPFIFDPMGGVNPNEPIENIPAGDVAKLVQNNTQYYLPVFTHFNKFNTSRFNFSAFLFSGGWMLYRKQYKIGSIITAIMVALSLASTYVSLNFAEPLYTLLLQQAGITSDSVSYTYAQLVQISDLLLKQPVEQIILFSVPSVIMIIQFIIMLVVGFNGNKWYLKHCVNKINQIHEGTTNPTDVTIQLQEQGGVNTALAICLLFCCIILMYIPLNII